MRTLVFSVFLVPFLFTSLLLAVSQSLHEKLHDDASKVSHQCAITLFAQQQILVSETDVHFIPFSGLLAWISDPASSIFSAVDYQFSTSRAPPFSLR